MSAISTYLEYIRSKIYAKDVRTAIVNAISQCYDDVNKPALQTEAMQAAVQAKIDAGQMAALTIGDGTITAAKFANGVIDNTLSQTGAAADAKAVGSKFQGLERGELELTEKTVIRGLYPVASGTIDVYDGAIMLVYPIINDLTYYITWLTGANKYRIAMGNTAPDEIEKGTIIYDYHDNANTSHVNCPITNDNHYNYLYVYVGYKSQANEQCAIVTRKFGDDMNSYFATDGAIWG